MKRNWKGEKGGAEKRTAALLPRRQEQPLESAVAISVQLFAKLGRLVVAAGVGVGSRLSRAGKVAPSAGIVVTVVVVIVLFGLETPSRSVYLHELLTRCNR
jgi:hypothetical protein